MSDSDEGRPGAPKGGDAESPGDAGTADAPKKKRGRGRKKPIDLTRVGGAPPPAGDAPAEAAGAAAPVPPAEHADAAAPRQDAGAPPAADSAAAAGGVPPQAPPVEAPEDATSAATAESPAGEAEDEAEAGAEDAPAHAGLRAAVEAIVFAADEPVTPAAIAKAIGNVKPSAVRKAIDELRQAREASGSGITIEEVAGGWAMLTREEYAPAIRRLRKATESRKLTGAALETLAVVAYRQPVQKQEIEDVRGVSCGPILRTLMEQDLVRIAGRAEALGRPLLYGTTKRFLDVFGLASLKDLPKLSEISQG